MSSAAYIYPILHHISQTAISRRANYGTTVDKNKLETFIYFICNEKNIPVVDFLSSSRKRNLVESRQWVCYYFTEYCRRMKLSKPTLGYIGEQLGDKDHATVLHSINVVQNLLDTNSVKRKEFTNLYNKYLND
jgi:chromosomal replication initiation ATPase DnaA